MIMVTKRSNHEKKSVYNIGCEGHESRNPGSMLEYYINDSLNHAQACWHEKKLM